MGSFPETYNDLTGKCRSMQGNPRQSWSVQSGIQSLESGVLKLISRFQSPGFRILLAKISRISEFSIFQLPIIHSVCPQILHKPLFLNAPGSIAFSQEHFKTISYAKFGGQTECIMGNWKIVNRGYLAWV